MPPQAVGRGDTEEWAAWRREEAPADARMVGIGIHFPGKETPSSSTKLTLTPGTLCCAQIMFNEHIRNQLLPL